jgi:hypothetical protein
MDHVKSYKLRKLFVVSIVYDLEQSLQAFVQISVFGNDSHTHKHVCNIYIYTWVKNF